MALCTHHDVCGLDALPGKDCCILHAPSSGKNKRHFNAALKKHRQAHDGQFSFMVFPDHTSFANEEFTNNVDFLAAVFLGKVDYSSTIFGDYAGFIYTKFRGEADFYYATFSGHTTFLNAKFSEKVYFSSATFTGEADFYYVTFSKYAKFSYSTFSGETDFQKSTFKYLTNYTSCRFFGNTDFTDSIFEHKVLFNKAYFKDRAYFRISVGDDDLKYQNTPHLFSGSTVDFRNITFNTPEHIIFANADLRQCQFMNTDLSKVSFTNIKWANHKRRNCIYDEILLRGNNNDDADNPNTLNKWEYIERTYRELKRNYEEQHDYDDMGDFHYGEKEARYQNPDTPKGMKLLLWGYRTLAGYGERILPTLVSAAALFVLSVLIYWLCSIRILDGSTLLYNTGVFSHSLLYTLKITFFMRPPAPGIEHPWLLAYYIFHSIASPLLLGSIALAVRQKMKR